MSDTNPRNYSINPIPTWEGVIEGWTRKFAKQQLWKFNGYLTLQELVQEGCCTYLETIERYKDSVENEKHFTSLYQVSLSNRFIDLAKKATAYRDSRQETTLNIEGEEISLFDVLEGDKENSGYLEILFRQAPAEIRLVIDFLSRSSTGQIEQIEKTWKKQGRKKSLQNSHLCKLLNFDPKKVDIFKLFQEHF